MSPAPQDRKTEFTEVYCSVCKGTTKHRRSNPTALWTCSNPHAPAPATQRTVKVVLPDGTQLEGPVREVTAVLQAIRGPRRATIESVHRATCAAFDLTAERLSGANRERSVTYPRMLAMYVCRVELGASFAEIGAAFGNRDHTTVMSAVRKIQDLVDSDDAQVLADIGRLGKL